jgi:uncharacterized protein
MRVHPAAHAHRLGTNTGADGSADEGFVRRHQLLTYFTLTFVISWGGMLVVAGGPTGFPATPENFKRLLPLVAFALMPGPSLAGLLAIGLFSGRAGFRDLLSRLLRWRVSGRWYAVAMLAMPILLTGVLTILSRFSSAYLPPILTAQDKLSPLLLAAAAGLAGGFLEELGWTGFAIPHLLRRHSVLATGLVVGVLWGVWHFLVNVWSSGALADGLLLPRFVPLYLVTGVAQLTAYRVLMVWVYERTNSLLLATLMHATLIVSTVQTVLTPAVTGWPFLTWFGASAVVLWMVVAAVAANGDLRALPSTANNSARIS